MLTHFKIATASDSAYIPLFIKRTADTIIFESSDNENIELQISKPQSCDNDMWGVLHVNWNNEIIPLADIDPKELSGEIELYIAINENQIPELNKQYQHQLADLNKSEDERYQERQQDKSRGDKLWHRVRRDVEQYEVTYPLAGSIRQIAWANDIRLKACKQVIFDDPEFAMLRIETAMLTSEMRHSKYWIDNRDSENLI